MDFEVRGEVSGFEASGRAWGLGETLARISCWAAAGMSGTRQVLTVLRMLALLDIVVQVVGNRYFTSDAGTPGLTISRIVHGPSLNEVL